MRIIVVMENHERIRVFIHDTLYDRLYTHAVAVHHYMVGNSYIEDEQRLHPDKDFPNLLYTAYTGSFGNRPQFRIFVKQLTTVDIVVTGISENRMDNFFKEPFTAFIVAAKICFKFFYIHSLILF